MFFKYFIILLIVKSKEVGWKVKANNLYISFKET
jgi:hypothetical protein